MLLVLDNAPGHPPHIVDLSEHIKVVFLPPNTTSIIQPMDQDVIATFKAHYVRRTFSKLIEETDGGDRRLVKDFWRKINIKHAIDIVAEAWAAVSSTCMNGVRKNVWPDCVHFKGFDVGENVSLLKSDILTFSRKVGFEEVNEEEAEDLLNAQHELSDEELIHDREEETQVGSCSDEMSEEPEAAVRTLKNKEIARAFCLIEEALQIFEDGDPDEIRSSKVNREVNAAMGVTGRFTRKIAAKPSNFPWMLSSKKLDQTWLDVPD
ncbi:tigger transposable element-derived protein 1-like [Ischnura elegans]|uniref:tigger transposable element-derived protein 1-like n=1 Tax=Ischnura elegans TaxID=197161 RepID=UPI001ED8A734|nr:tigger transposable element-derived protein 1-like [Ischnura elegans]